MEKYLNDCAEPPFNERLDIDPVNPLCPNCDIEPSQKDVPIIQDNRHNKYGTGRAANCHPAQSGHIIDDFKQDPQRLMEPWMSSYIPKYSKSKRSCDEAVKNLFEDLVVIDEQGSANKVPIIWATQERAVAAIIQSNVRKDDSTIIDRLRLPLMAIHDSEFSINNDRYIYHEAIDYLRERRVDRKPGSTIQENRHPRDTIFGVTRGLPVDIGYNLFAWTLYKEDMNQILEQIVLKFSPIAYIKVQGVYWETIVKLESIANNENLEPGGNNLRVIKWQFNLRAETFIPQPIVRKKAVLRTTVNVVDDIDDAQISEILARLESSIERKHD